MFETDLKKQKTVIIGNSGCWEE